MWHIIHLIRPLEGKYDAIACRQYSTGACFLTCEGFAGQTDDIRQLICGRVDSDGGYARDPLVAEEILNETSPMSIPYTSILLVETVE